MILEIARMGHPVLEARAKEVEDVSAPHIQQFIADFVETFQSLGGVGLAAPQVKESLRIIVIELTAEIAAARDVDAFPLAVLINPVIEPLSDAMETRWEACFSLPGLMGEVERHRSIRYTALTPAGEKISHAVHGYQARVIQHELDHLDGILYPQRMRNMKKFGFIDEIKQTLMPA